MIPTRGHGPMAFVWGGLLPLLSLFGLAGLASSLNLSLTVVQVGGIVICIISAGLTWIFGRRLNKPLEDAGYTFTERHSIAYIPYEWWCILPLFMAFVVVTAIVAPIK